MPLSEHEQRMLDEMERQLFADDPRLAKSFRGPSAPAASPRKLAMAVGALVLGLGMIVAAVLLPMVPLGVLGFVLMLGGVIWALTSNPAQHNSAESSHGVKFRNGSASSRPSSGGFVQRMEDRWDRRSHNGGV